MQPTLSEGEMLTVFTVRFAVGIAIDMIIIGRTRAKLAHHFRLAASRDLFPARK
jgi:hypothetical protein